MIKMSEQEESRLLNFLRGKYKREPEKVPTTRLGVECARINENGRIFGKEYTLGEMNGEKTLFRNNLGEDPAGFENLLLSLYRKAGQNVPEPCHFYSDEHILLMEDLGDDSLEKRMKTASKRDAIKHLKKVVREMQHLHKGGREIQAEVIAKIPESFKKSEKLLEKGIEYYTILALPSEDNRLIRSLSDPEQIPSRLRESAERFADFFGVVTRNIYGESQLIHGDMTTYHIYFTQQNGNERIFFIDFGSPKLLPVGFDLADLFISPEIPDLSVEEILEVYNEYIEEHRLKGVRGGFGIKSVARNIIDEENKKLCYIALFECLRCASKQKKERLFYPREFERYAEAHPKYANPESHYKDVALKFREFLLRKADSDAYRLSDGDKRNLEMLESYFNDLLVFPESESSTSDPEEAEISSKSQ